jgi:hypothetical protein
MMDGEMERILEGGNCVLMEVLSQHLPEGTDKNYKKLSEKPVTQPRFE